MDLADSAAATVRELRNHQFDLILSNFHLGDGPDGHGLHEDLRNNQSIPMETRVLRVTGVP